jgi:hypothetical protein
MARSAGLVCVLALVCACHGSPSRASNPLPHGISALSADLDMLGETSLVPVKESYQVKPTTITHSSVGAKAYSCSG